MALYRRKRKQPTHDRPSDYRELWSAVIMLIIVGTALALIYVYSRSAPPDVPTVATPPSQPRTP